MPEHHKILEITKTSLLGKIQDEKFMIINIFYVFLLILYKYLKIACLNNMIYFCFKFI